MKITQYDGKEHKININHRKDRHFTESYIGLVFAEKDVKKVKEVCELRLYCTQSVAYACVWVHDDTANEYTSGSGRADGGGYHRPSAAAAEAIKSAGYEMDETIDARGDMAIREAVAAICRYYYPTKHIYVVHAHA